MFSLFLTTKQRTTRWSSTPVAPFLRPAAGRTTRSAGRRGPLCWRVGSKRASWSCLAKLQKYLTLPTTVEVETHQQNALTAWSSSHIMVAQNEELQTTKRLVSWSQQQPGAPKSSCEDSESKTSMALETA